EPNTDLLRFVVSPYRHRTPLDTTPHKTKVTVEGVGTRSRREVFELLLPGLRTHLTPEDAELQLGDPIAFSFDVHDLDIGQATLTLDEIDGAEGIVVRAYRREHLDPDQAARRRTALNVDEKDHLATWAWEPGWNELSNVERDAILATRWRKIGALRDASGELR